MSYLLLILPFTDEIVKSQEVLVDSFGNGARGGRFRGG